MLASKSVGQDFIEQGVIRAGPLGCIFTQGEPARCGVNAECVCLLRWPRSAICAAGSSVSAYSVEFDRAVAAQHIVGIVNLSIGGRK